MYRRGSSGIDEREGLRLLTGQLSVGRLHNETRPVDSYCKEYLALKCCSGPFGCDRVCKRRWNACVFCWMLVTQPWRVGTMPRREEWR